MAESPLRLVKRSAEFRPMAEVKLVPRGRRGLYVLYRGRQIKGKQHYNVVYIGLAKTGIRSRLFRHVRNKPDRWTHFSVYEVWDNIRDEEIVELEGLFRHLYRLDSKANVLNIQKGFKLAKMVRQDDFSEWS